MSNIKVDPIVQSKLSQFKKDSGSKTYSDAINLLIHEIVGMKRQKQILMFENKWEKARIENIELKKKNQELQLLLETSEKMLIELREGIE